MPKMPPNAVFHGGKWFLQDLRGNLTPYDPARDPLAALRARQKTVAATATAVSEPKEERVILPTITPAPTPVAVAVDEIASASESDLSSRQSSSRQSVSPLVEPKVKSVSSVRDTTVAVTAAVTATPSPTVRILKKDTKDFKEFAKAHALGQKIPRRTVVNSNKKLDVKLEGEDSKINRTAMDADEVLTRKVSAFYTPANKGVREAKPTHGDVVKLSTGESKSGSVRR